MRAYQASLKGPEPDFDARNRLVEDHLPMIRHIAKAFQASNRDYLEIEELVNAGCLGMIQGLERFKPEKGNKVSTYCMWWVRDAMHKLVRHSRWHGSLSDDEYRGLLRLHRQLAAVFSGFDATVDFRVLARRMGWTLTQTRRMFAC